MFTTGSNGLSRRNGISVAITLLCRYKKVIFLPNKDAVVFSHALSERRIRRSERESCSFSDTRTEDAVEGIG